jgi:hypothetical protein
LEAVITGIRGSTLANSDVSNVGRFERKDILAGNAMSRSDGVAGFDEFTVRKPMFWRSRRNGYVTWLL